MWFDLLTTYWGTAYTVKRVRVEREAWRHFGAVKHCMHWHVAHTAWMGHVAYIHSWATLLHAKSCGLYAHCTLRFVPYYYWPTFLSKGTKSNGKMSTFTFTPCWCPWWDENVVLGGRMRKKLAINKQQQLIGEKRQWTTEPCLLELKAVTFLKWRQ